MKNIAELMPTVNQVDVIENHSKRNERQERAIKSIEKLFEDLKPHCPVTFKTLSDDEINKIKREWMVAFIENKVNPAMLGCGVSIARIKSNKFLPTAGEFIEWCKQGLKERYKLIDKYDLVKLHDRYCASKGFDSHHEFDYGSDANFWLVTDLYQETHRRELNEHKTLDRADELINKLAQDLMNGFVIPKPNIALPKKVKSRPLNREQQLSKIDEIKRKFRFNYASQQATTSS